MATNATAKSGETKVTAQPIQATSVHEMMAYTCGLVKLPPFGVGMPCVVKLKRPSLMALIKSGKIPNTLMASATKLFNEGTLTSNGDDASKNEETMKNMSEMLEVFARASMIEPTYQELQDAGVELTDLQLMAIFSYSQSGVKDLERFPEK